MFKFNKSMAGVKRDEVPESQDCGCGPKKSQASAGSSCCGPVKSSCGESNPEKKQITECTPCSAPVKNPCSGNSSEKSETSTESSCSTSPNSSCCG